MMSDMIRQETAVFLISALHGAALALLYDLLRALRRSFAHGFWLVSAEDFLYWITAGFLTFCLLFSWTEGRIRGYTSVGIALGAVLYRLTLGPAVVKGVSWILQTSVRTFHRMVRFLKRAAALLIRPLRRLAGYLARLPQRLAEYLRRHLRRPAGRPADHPRGSAGRPANFPRGSAGRPADHPRGSAGRPANFPRGSAGHPAGSPRGSAGHPADSPRGSAGRPADFPRGSAGHPADFPRGQTGHPADFKRRFFHCRRGRRTSRHNVM